MDSSNHLAAMIGSEVRKPTQPINRRAFVHALGALGAAAAMPALGQEPATAPGPILKRSIPSTGEQIPAIGMGTWITFNVGNNQKMRAARTQVLQTFFDRGGGLIDSSPMYGSSEAVIGHGLARIQNRGGLFSATKVWTVLKALGVRQMEASRRLWDIPRFDLLQVHNLLDWQAHMETLKAMKAQGHVRYIGITTSHGSRHEEFERIMLSEPIDFVQFTYNVVDRRAEQRLLPLAAERGQAVIINRPFREGELFQRLGRHPLPQWASEFDCTSWAQFVLKFIVSHPAVTCAIPATTRTDHMAENMGVLVSRLPDAKTRQRMVRYVESL